MVSVPGYRTDFHCDVAYVWVTFGLEGAAGLVSARGLLCFLSFPQSCFPPALNGQSLK